MMASHGAGAKEIFGYAVRIILSKDGIYVMECECADKILLHIPVNFVKDLHTRPIVDYFNEADNKLYRISTTGVPLPEAILNQKGDPLTTTDPPVDTKKEKFQWSIKDTKALIYEYKRHQKLKAEGKFKYLADTYGPISEILKKLGCEVDRAQVESKMKSLLRDYNNKKKHNNSTGRNYKKIEFEEELDDLLKDKHNIWPKLTIGSIAGQVHRQAPMKEKPPNASIPTSPNASTSSPPPPPQQQKSPDPQVTNKDSVDADEDQDKLIDQSMLTSPNSPTKTTKRKGAMLLKVTEANDVLKRIENQMESRNNEKKQRLEEVVGLYKGEVEDSKKFRNNLILAKQEKNRLLQELINKK